MKTGRWIWLALALAACAAPVAEAQPLLTFDTDAPDWTVGDGGVSAYGSVDFSTAGQATINLFNNSTHDYRITGFYLMQPVTGGGSHLDAVSLDSPSGWNLDGDDFGSVLNPPLSPGYSHVDSYFGADTSFSEGLAKGDNLSFTFTLESTDALDLDTYLADTKPLLFLHWEKCYIDDGWGDRDDGCWWDGWKDGWNRDGGCGDLWDGWGGWGDDDGCWTFTASSCNFDWDGFSWGDKDDNCWGDKDGWDCFDRCCRKVDGYGDLTPVPEPRLIGSLAVLGLFGLLMARRRFHSTHTRR